MEMAWGGVAATTGGKETEPGGNADSDYYRRWITEEFGPRSSMRSPRCIRSYFAASAPRPPFGRLG